MRRPWDVYARTANLLRELGHDVATASEIGLAQAIDAELLRTAHEQERVFVTRDRDYGGLVFVECSRAGVIYLRVLPSTQAAIHAELERILTLYSEKDRQGSFVVIEPGRHRIRKPAPNP